jgi:hypothetical protein
MTTVNPRQVASIIWVLSLGLALSIPLCDGVTAASEAEKPTDSTTSLPTPDHFIITKSAKVIGRGGRVHYHTFLLDNSTGETWEMFCAPNGTVEFRKIAVEGLPRTPAPEKTPPHEAQAHTFPPGLWDGLAGALVGGFISAIVVVIFESRSKRTEVALEIAQQFFEQYEELAEVKGLLGAPQHLLGQPNAANMNRVQKFGDWCETVSAVCLEKASNRAILKRIGIPGAIKDFLDRAQGAAAQVPNLGTAIANWTNLQEYMRKENP